MVAWEQLGVAVRERRAELNLTQSEVTDRGGPSVPALRMIENNRAGRLSPRMRHALERALQWRPGSVDALLAGGTATPIEQSPQTPPSVPPPSPPGADRFGLAKQVLSLKATFAAHREGMEPATRKALGDEISRSASEAEEGIATLMPWLNEQERGEATKTAADHSAKNRPARPMFSRRGRRRMAGMSDIAPGTPKEAAAVADAALALAGYEVPPFVRDLTAKMGRGEMTGDEAVEVIIARHTRGAQSA
jgi:hypothetical protein